MLRSIGTNNVEPLAINGSCMKLHDRQLIKSRYFDYQTLKLFLLVGICGTHVDPLALFFILFYFTIIILRIYTDL